MRKTGLSFLVLALMIIFLPSTAFTQKHKGGRFLHIYGKDRASWIKAEQKLRKSSEVILTIFFNMPCQPKQGLGSAMIGFLIGRDNQLMAVIPRLTGPWGPKAGFTTIPLDFKCGLDRASGSIDIYIKGNIIMRGQKKFLRFIMHRKWNCVFKSDMPRYDPLHGKKCHEPAEDSGVYEIPLKNGYITEYPGSIYNFALEVVKK